MIRHPLSGAEEGVVCECIPHPLFLAGGDEVLRVLAALQTGGLCGAGWSAGESTLHPDELKQKKVEWPKDIPIRIYKKLDLNPNMDYQESAIGILSMTPSEISVIAGDIAIKTAKVDIGFIDRLSGTLGIGATHPADSPRRR